MKKFIVSCTIAAFTVLECGVLTSCDQDSDVSDQWGNSEILSLANKKKTQRMETPSEDIICAGYADDTYNCSGDSITIFFHYSWPRAAFEFQNLTVTYNENNQSKQNQLRNISITNKNVNTQEASFQYNADIYRCSHYYKHINATFSSPTNVEKVYINR
jgi:hypothetical protein